MPTTIRDEIDILCQKVLISDYNETDLLKQEILASISKLCSDRR
jgi:hypothetical protein